ncbi:hypothetical protein OAT16_09900 [Prolixibacteraceae bacterium]|nr:hypothetical protein [Prolixibacteraceae bacterium]
MKSLPIAFVLYLWLCLSLQGIGVNSGNKFDITPLHFGKIQIPWIQNVEHPMIAGKINSTIQMTLFDCLYDPENKQPFVDAIDNRSSHGQYQQSYEILSNNQAVLSIKILVTPRKKKSPKECAYLNFNAATGEMLDLRSLVTNKGLRRLETAAGEFFNQSIQDAFFKRKEPLRADPNEITALERQAFYLTECNATHLISQFGIVADSLIVTKRWCYDFKIENDIDWTTKIPVSLFRGYELTPLGEMLLEEHKSTTETGYNTRIEKMTLHGTIESQHTFNMILDLFIEQVIGSYWEDQYGELIEFSAKKVNPNTIEIRERRGKMILVIHPDGTLTGKWIKRDGKQSDIIFH